MEKDIVHRKKENSQCSLKTFLIWILKLFQNRTFICQQDTKRKNPTQALTTGTKKNAIMHHLIRTPIMRWDNQWQSWISHITFRRITSTLTALSLKKTLLKLKKILMTFSVLKAWKNRQKKIKTKILFWLEGFLLMMV